MGRPIKMTAAQFDAFAPEHAKEEKNERVRDITPSDIFLAQVQVFKNLDVRKEYMFAKSIGRRWLFDFAFPDFMVAVEIEGIIPLTVWRAFLIGREPVVQNGRVINVTKCKKLHTVMGRHASVGGFYGDMEKYNTAAQLGWFVIRFAPKQIRPRHAIDKTLEVLASRGWRSE